ncbi:MAG TPA: pro-sigmaK processing inhibitor BofA family protein [Candidatus Faecimonas gallistercoris]|nr:pro-sigmaK processing inhibitor BofA family protein [Candidatus Faecimonas gallistercoris]
MKNIVSLMKKIIISGFLLYGYNLIAVNFNMILPINVITLFSVTFLGTPALFALVLFRILFL